MICQLLSNNGTYCQQKAVAERDGMPVCAKHQRHPEWGRTLEQYSAMTQAKYEALLEKAKKCRV